MPSGTMQGLAEIGQAAGPALSVVGTIAGGMSANRLAGAQADQLIQNAGTARAVGQRNAINTRLNTRLVLSRQTAIAAASGAGVTNPTVQNIEAETGARGEYAALTDLYNGDSAAQDMLMKAAYTRMSGREAQSAAFLKAGGTLAGGAMTLLDRYGAGGPPGGSASSYDLALSDGG